jgi:hypothetical protein
MSQDHRSKKASTLSDATSSMAVGFLAEKVLRGQTIEVPSLKVSFNRTDLVQHPNVNESGSIPPKNAQ